MAAQNAPAITNAYSVTLTDFAGSGGGRSLGLNESGVAAWTAARVPGSFDELDARVFVPSVRNGGNGRISTLSAPPGYANATVSAINKVGQVAGAIGAAGGQLEPALWVPSGGDPTVGQWISLVPGRAGTAGDVNDVGQVVGFYFDDVINALSCFLWTPATPNGTFGTLVTLPLPTAGTSLGMIAINNYGQVAALVPSGGAATQYLWTPSSANGSAGNVVVLQSPTGQFQQTGVNDYGQVVGSIYNTATFTSTAVVWTPASRNGETGTFTAIPAPIATTVSNGLAINDRGEVLAAGIGPQFLGFYLWQPDPGVRTTGVSAPLPTPSIFGSWEGRLNRKRQIVYGGGFLLGLSFK